MALVKLGPMFAEASGKIGGLVAARNRGGAYVREWTKPLVSTSTEALAAKARLGAYAQGWAGITANERAAWHSWANGNPVTNRLGETRVLSGHQAYVQLNTVIDLVGGTPIDVPPVTTAPGALLTLVFDGDIGAGDFDLTYTATPLAAGIMLYLRGCQVNSPGIKYVTNLYKHIGVSAAAQASPFDIQTLWDARLGAAQVGQTCHIEVRLVDSLSGLVGPPIRTSVVATST